MGLRIRAVELRALPDPLLHQRDLRFRQGVVFLGHPVVRVRDDEQTEQLALRRLAGRDGGGRTREVKHPVGVVIRQPVDG